MDRAKSRFQEEWSLITKVSNVVFKSFVDRFY